MGIWTSTPTYEQIRARNNRAAVVSVPLPASFAFAFLKTANDMQVTVLAVGAF